VAFDYILELLRHCGIFYLSFHLYISVISFSHVQNGFHGDVLHIVLNNFIDKRNLEINCTCSIFETYLCIISSVVLVLKGWKDNIEISARRCLL
jgi:hypothetical protein